MQGRYNTRSPAVKRLMREAQELSEPTDQYFAQPLEDNLFEWHFTVRGPLDSDFQNGIYHGRIILPVDYPMKPPSIIWLTPNGRFETNKKICLSISGHHPESWQPSWSIRTALLAIIGFMPTHPGGAIGSLAYKPEERKALAKKSRDWKCPTCGDISEVLLDVSTEPSEASKEAKELAAQISFQGEKPKGKEECPIETAASTSAANPSTATPTPPTTTVEGSSNNATANPWNNEQGRPLPQDFFPPFTPWGFPAGAMPNAPNTPNLTAFQSPQSTWGSPSTNGGQENRVASMVPRFPYPPSFYPGGYHVPFYPPGFALPPGVGMFPCPYPPPLSSRLTSTPGDRTHVSMAPPINSVTSTTPASSRPLMSFPSAPVSPNIEGREQGAEKSPKSLTSSPAKKDMMNELLSRVKRVGSDDKASKETNSKGATPKENVTAGNQEFVMETGSGGAKKSELLKEEKEFFEKKPGAAENIIVEEVMETVGDSSFVAAAADRKQDSVPGETDSEVSQSLLKKESLNGLTGSNISRSELLNDEDDNSESGVPPIEMSDTEQRSNFERSTTSSMSDLQKRRKQGAGIKGLRQRQSALAQVPTNITEDAPADNDQAANSGGRQRIEAASGDNSPPNRFIHEANRTINVTRRYHREVMVRTRPRGSHYDVSFMVMVGLSIATIIILLNRFFQIIDWSDVNTSEY